MTIHIHNQIKKHVYKLHLSTPNKLRTCKKRNMRRENSNRPHSNILVEIGIKSIFVSATISIKRHIEMRTNRYRCGKKSGWTEWKRAKKEQEQKKNWYSHRDLSFICEFHYA